MITALIAALFMLALGIAAKGAVAHALVIGAAWLTKNILLLGFLRSPTGKRTAKAIHRATYARLDEKKRQAADHALARLRRLFGKAKPARPGEDHPPKSNSSRS